MLKISSPQDEGVIQVSKALKIRVLLDEKEMEDLVFNIGDFEIYDVSRVVGEDHGFIDKRVFLRGYSQFVEALRTGKFPDESLVKHLFSSVFTMKRELLYAMKVGEKKFLIKALRPIIQLQTHHLLYSELDGKFHSIAQGKETIAWGLQFSYPQIFQDPKSKSFSKVTSTPDFPNTALFLALQQWMRQNTLPTPFMVQGKKINLPVRLGKRCFSWIERHPCLIEKGFQIACPSKLLP